MRILLLVGIYLLSFNYVYAGPVDSIRAKKIAANFFVKHGKSSGTNDLRLIKSGIKNKSGLKKSQPQATSLFIVNKKGTGFVIISGNDIIQPVLGYSFTDSIDSDNMPPALAEWINWREREIEFIASNNSAINDEILNAWNKLENIQITEALTDYKEPLIKTYWGQGTYYNDLCPLDASSGYSNDRVPVGCVATAMAQIMKYWEYPATGTGSRSYTPASHPEYGLQSANFGTSAYTWVNMPITTTVANTEIANIMYHCGVSVSMDYGPDGSSSSLSTGMTSLKNYFNYKNTLSYVSKTSYTTSGWNNLIRSEIDSYRPVLLRGASSDQSGGHAYICDGYYGNDYFHINWGWTGFYNGYFMFNDLTPGTDDFSYFQSAGIGIVPNSSSCSVYPAAMSVVSSSGVTSQFWITSNTTWTVSDNQTWLDIGTTSGTGCNKIEISINSENTTGISRTATITVTPNGLSPKTITVTQLASSAALPNLIPYKPITWSDKIVVSKVKGTTTDDNITVQDSVYVDFRYANTGTANATGMFCSWLLLNDIILVERPRDGLSANYSMSHYDFELGKLTQGTYTLTVKIDALGNILESNDNDNIYTRTFIVSNVTSLQDISEKKSDDVILFPNPSVDKLNVNNLNEGIKKIRIMNSGGFCVFLMETSEKGVVISVSQLPMGIYILRIETDSECTNYKFVKQ